LVGANRVGTESNLSLYIINNTANQFKKQMKELKEFPGYFVTEDGRVFSGWKSNGKVYYNDLKQLKPRENKCGYSYVILCKNRNRFTKKVHRLVAETYIENPDNLPQVNHIDENKLNNHISNLEWVTMHQNNIHSKCRWIWSIENIITGEIIETINLNEFARDNNLDRNHLHKTLSKKINQHKNHRIISKTQFK
jgi:hypothetical protein